ncbi:MAG TPA: VWA domain-containing protein [Pyrinomonadaceae bacterium]|nr:VWA domain-containing protein [Pyrinomonadaceae bacterium]
MHHHSFFLRHGSRCLSLLLTSAIFLAAIPAQSQDNKQTRSGEDQDEVIKITSNMVSVDVMVKDKRGKAITDLRAEDFVLSENGVRQNIEFFDSTLAGENEPGQPSSTSVLTAPRTPNGLPRNIIALVLDGQTTEGANLKRVRDGMTKYIRERISDTDLVGLFAISGELQLLQPFTQDKGKLIAAVDRADGASTGSKTAEQRGINDAMAVIRDDLAAGPTGVVTSPAGGSALARAMILRRMLEQYVQLRSALSSQQTRPVLAGLAAISEGLRAIPGKKTVVVFSQGFVAPQALDWQVQSTIDLANRANVAIYVIDSSGLTGGTPQSGALVPSSALSAISAETSQENRIRAGAGESVFDVARQEGLNRQQDLLYRISGDTGGQFIKNTNDIGAGLERIHQEIRSRYTLAYRSTDPNFDGSFRKVKIEVRRADARVLARPGYYAIAPDQVVPFSPEDKKLLGNFDTMLTQSTLPLSLQLHSFRSQPGYYVVPLSFELPPTAVKFERKGARQRLQLDVLGLVKSAGDDKIISRLGGNFDVELTTEQFISISNDKIFYRQDIQLEAGEYTFDLVVKDRLSGRVAARRQRLSLPLDDSQFSVTEAVLSRHAEPLRQPAAGVDVLSAGSVQIRPSPSREFQTTDNLIIFFKLYNATPAAATGKSLVGVTLTIMKDGKPVMKPLDYQLTDVVTEPVPHLTFAKYVKLTGLVAGKYSVAIEATDMAQRKVVRQEASFVVTQ